MNFETVDRLFEDNEFEKGFEELMHRNRQGERSAELFWRISRFCHELSTSLTGEQKREMILEGRNFGLEAMELDPTNFNAIKWAAILFGLVVDTLPTKEKIVEGGKLKDMLDKALEMDPTDFALLHLRARFLYTIANLSWLERKAASMLYSEVPKASIDDALADFVAASKSHPDWIENLLFISKCCMAKKDKSKAREYLSKAVNLKADSSNDMELMGECKKLMEKC